jgi:adenine-specific DNA-methyltransferase
MEYTCPTCKKQYKSKKPYEKHMSEKDACIVKNADNSFSSNSLQLNKKISKEVRQSQGIFFTPKKARALIFEKLNEFQVKPTHILEPSFGSGEFLDDIESEYPGVKVTGVELNKTLFDSVKKPSMTLVNSDFLAFDGANDIDLSVANPPYFVFDKEYPECMEQRPNIYVAFLYKTLTKHLKQNGWLAFVLPTSLYNCSYYAKMREYIYKNCTIQYLTNLDVDYYQTQQDTMAIFIQKKEDPMHKYFFTHGSKLYINPYADRLNTLVQNTKTLEQLKLRVKTGEVVWNQMCIPLKKKQVEGKPYPDFLTDEPSQTLLIYNSNIVNCRLELDILNDKEGRKKQYVKKTYHKPPVSGPAILINRGYGNAYAFNFIFLKSATFFAENHVNMILPREGVSKEEALTILKQVDTSLRDPRTNEFIDKFVGNGALSATELQTILPIFM